MRPRSRPFMVEIKSSKRTAQPASAASCAHPNNLDDLIPSGDLPARDIQPFVPREALREAEKLFGRFAGDQPRSTRRTAARRQSPPMPSLRLLW
jgi:hypothetical protein